MTAAAHRPPAPCGATAATIMISENIGPDSADPRVRRARSAGAREAVQRILVLFSAAGSSRAEAHLAPVDPGAFTMWRGRGDQTAGHEMSASARSGGAADDEPGRISTRVGGADTPTPTPMRVVVPGRRGRR